MTATCFECGKTFRVYKNDRVCADCELDEWERRRAKGAASRKSHRPRSLACRIAPFLLAAQQPAQSLAMRLFGKRAEKA